jgi:hypothetical protein
VAIITRPPEIVALFNIPSGDPEMPFYIFSSTLILGHIFTLEVLPSFSSSMRKTDQISIISLSDR